MKTTIETIDLEIRKYGDPWERLPKLAERLGVSPIIDDASHLPPTVILSTQSGKNYDMFDLIDALLDRLEGV